MDQNRQYRSRSNSKVITRVIGSSSSQTKDAHERFRDKIIHGRDMGDMEEELNTVRAQSRTQTNLIRMKEEQILKYKSGLEKAKSILKDMVHSTQQKMKKLQDDVNELQETLRQKELKIRNQSLEIVDLSRQIKTGANNTHSWDSEKEKLQQQLRMYESNSRAINDRYSSHEKELHERNVQLKSANGRLQSELSSLRSKYNKKMEEDRSKTQELHRLHALVSELQSHNNSSSAASRADSASSRLTFDRLRKDLEGAERQLANSNSMMEDVGFFVNVKNGIDDFVTETNNSLASRVDLEREKVKIPDLICPPTFKAIMEAEVEDLPELGGRLNREVEEDQRNCRRALKEMQSKAYFLLQSIDDTKSTLKNNKFQSDQFGEIFSDIEASLEKIDGNVSQVHVFGDDRDKQSHEVNPGLSGFRGSEGRTKMGILWQGYGN